MLLFKFQNFLNYNDLISKNNFAIQRQKWFKPHGIDNKIRFSVNQFGLFVVI